MDARLVARSFQAVSSRADELSAAFYRRLFEGSPELRAFFPDDMTMQRMQLVQSLVFVVAAADDLGSIRPMVASLGERHVAYGAKAEHYPLVAEALIGALREIGGEAFGTAEEVAWRVLLRRLSEMMLEGAARAAA